MICCVSRLVIRQLLMERGCSHAFVSPAAAGTLLKIQASIWFTTRPDTFLKCPKHATACVSEYIVVVDAWRHQA